MQLSVGKVRRLIEDQVLPAVRVDGIVKVPAEFVVNGEPLSSLRGTVTLLRDLGLTQDEAVAWVVSENDTLGERPIEALRRGAKSTVRRAAQTAGF